MTTVRHGYEFIKKIGSGGYGNIWKTVKNNEVYAIKEFNDNSDGIITPKEIDISLRYDHPNLMKAVDFFFDLQLPKPKNPNPYIGFLDDFDQNPISTFLVMELADTDLLNYIEPDIKEKTRIRLCYELASAVNFLNETGFHHCDIKPENCLMINNTLKLGDYGLVKFRGVTTDVCQSTYYSSPEVLNYRFKIFPKDDRLSEDEEIKKLNSEISENINLVFKQKISSEAADIWALGTVFVFILTGKIMFEGAHPYEIIKKIVHYISDPLNYLYEIGLDEKWNALIVRMLEPNVESRIKNISEVLRYDIFVDSGYGTAITGKNRWEPLKININHDKKVNITVDWMLEVFDEYDINIYVAHSSITLFYYLYQNFTDHGRLRDKIQLLSVACILLSDKLYSRETIGVDELIYISGNTYTSSQIREMEREIIIYMGGILYYPTLATIAFSDAALGKCLPILKDSQIYKITDIYELMEKLEMEETVEERENRIPVKIKETHFNL